MLTAFETECRGDPDCRLSQVIEGPIHFFGLCEHHALPFHGHAYVGYIAHEHIIGISKLTRLVRLFAKRFTVQERIGQQIAGTLEAMLAPHGVAVYLEAHHLCTQMRGVREIAPLTHTTFLRAVADVVIVGAGTLRSVPQHRWTAQYIYPPLAGVYQQLRSSLRKPAPPLNVIVTTHGEISLDLPVFQSGEVQVLIVTIPQGSRHISRQVVPSAVRVATVQGDGKLSAQTILEAVSRMRQSEVILVEGGPQLMGDFFAGQALDELFLTLAPQVAGRDGQVERPGLVMGKRFAPEHPLWGTLVSIKQHLIRER